jgi:hypothetical protein
VGCLEEGRCCCVDSTITVDCYWLQLCLLAIPMQHTGIELIMRPDTIIIL